VGRKIHNFKFKIKIFPKIKRTLGDSSPVAFDCLEATRNYKLLWGILGWARQPLWQFVFLKPQKLA
jgi:hypothetical protein